MNTFYENVKIALEINWKMFFGKVGNWDAHQISTLLQPSYSVRLLSLFDEDNENREKEWKELFNEVGMPYSCDIETGEKDPLQELGIEF